ncbi:hypothetical protein [Mesomycoplasma ovipneumoniae]|uniref:Uncharacterized protein n=1 Tax=Mesomycoplasma ovipneumoniae TaxID=29562 RepID=A0AAP6CU71_9BACT|nr:hypothetical protein [Mesomycoplasma ovipneumoniae]MDW2907606.1 hypothetical protein [Mesomycoplasma ovipneumoniae]MDW2908889.1 hypothetical protein [Mesomycoplasma ovipneumoniae]MDW2910271.1 hypothetical protein [Mesomycoplasma ovipneumoniae]MDW2911456.1 hypothetical protein [Mesomycoplasma ovipneumoniae]MDW2912056.1 hypothetical protein [Mesomycoplasma ovipneumoniae]
MFTSFIDLLYGLDSKQKIKRPPRRPHRKIEYKFDQKLFEYLKNENTN